MYRVLIFAALVGTALTTKAVSANETVVVSTLSPATTVLGDAGEESTATFGRWRRCYVSPRVVYKPCYPPVVSQPVVVHPQPHYYPPLLVDNCPPVRPTPPSPPTKLGKSQVAAGSTITAPTKFLGSETGYVFLNIGGARQECAITNWKHNLVTFTLPTMDLRNGVPAKVEIMRPDGKMVRSYDVTLMQPSLYVHDNSEFPRGEESPAPMISMMPLGPTMGN